MPNRIIKESICTSETLNSLSAEQEVFFYRLLVQCDDYGRMDARPAILLGRCYSLRLEAGTMKVSTVAGYMRALEKAGLIRFYIVAGKCYLQVVTWAVHQQIRAKHSKYPAPPAEAAESEQAEEAPTEPEIEPASIGADVISRDSTCSRIRIRIRESNTRIENPILSVPDEAESPDTLVTGLPPKRQTAQQSMVGVLAQVCVLDPKLQGGLLGKAAKQLLTAGYGPEQVQAAYGEGAWWYQNDWRGKQQQPPTVGQIQATIVQAVMGRTTGDSNGWKNREPPPAYRQEVAVVPADFKLEVG